MKSLMWNRKLVLIVVITSWFMFAPFPKHWWAIYVDRAIMFMWAIYVDRTFMSIKEGASNPLREPPEDGTTP